MIIKDSRSQTEDKFHIYSTRCLLDIERLAVATLIPGNAFPRNEVADGAMRRRLLSPTSNILGSKSECSHN